MRGKTRLEIHARLSFFLDTSGAEGSRTLDLYNANVALSQLSYSPRSIVSIYEIGSLKTIQCGDI